MSYQFYSVTPVSPAADAQARKRAEEARRHAEDKADERKRDQVQEQIKSQRRSEQALNDRTRQQLIAADVQRRIQQQEEQNATLAKTVQAVVVVGALNATIRKDLLEKLDEEHQVETPFANHIRSAFVEKVPNSPIFDQLKIQLEYDGATPQEAEELLRPTPAVQAQLDAQRQQQTLEFLHSTYDIDFQTKKETENHLQTAREVYENLFGKDAEGKVRTIDDQANQAIEVKLALTQHVEQAALRAGQTDQVARAYANEVATLFVVEQAKAHEQTDAQQKIVTFLKSEQEKGQDISRGIATKEELKHIRVATTGTETLHVPGTKNLEDDVAEKLKTEREARAHAPQTQAGYDALGHPIGTQKFEEPKEPVVTTEVAEPEPINTSYATVGAQTNMQDETGRPDDNFRRNDLNAADAADDALRGGAGYIGVHQNNSGISAHGAPVREIGAKVIVSPYPNAQN